MAEWKIECKEIQLFPHPNADNLEIAKVGERQYVVQKGLYCTGEFNDFAISVPEKSILPDEIADDGYRAYLKGPDKNRVGAVTLRGEISEGILLDPAKWLGKNAYNPDFDMSSEGLANWLGIRQYIPPIPDELKGQAAVSTLGFKKHDCDQFSINEEKVMMPGEEVIVTEKIHGSQINITVEFSNGLETVEVAMKSMGAQGICIQESTDNFYWRALRNTNILDLVEKHWGNLGNGPTTVQVVGEAVPIHKGFNYGFKKPTVLVFRIIVNGKTLPFSNVPPDFDPLWVPILLIKKVDANTSSEIRALAEGQSKLWEGVREGVVVTSETNPNVHLKFINPKFQKRVTGEEFN